jgi:hypothetical protein
MVLFAAAQGSLRRKSFSAAPRLRVNKSLREGPFGTGRLVIPVQLR